MLPVLYLCKDLMPQGSAEVERDFLEIDGFEVIHEMDGREGMERALAGGLDLILLDLMLPGVGYRFMK
jgi:DNA-binding response OmpR family regulator